MPKLEDLPHRPPFVFVREILEIGEAEGHCRTWFDTGESFFGGHFPGDPIVPGVLLTEALAQASGLCVGRGGRLLLSGIRRMTFRGAVRPGERVDLRVKLVSEMGGNYLFEVCAEVKGHIVAEGQVILSRG